jgi:uncharacterized paraquat-inducible protein A
MPVYTPSDEPSYVEWIKHTKEDVGSFIASTRETNLIRLLGFGNNMITDISAEDVYADFISLNIPFCHVRNTSEKCSTCGSCGVSAKTHCEGCVQCIMVLYKVYNFI